MKLMVSLFWMIVGIMVNSVGLAHFGCRNYVKTHQRITKTIETSKNLTGPNKFNNWITFTQMEARRNERWQARMKRVRDQKREAQTVVGM